jgi:hypothetical protein
MDTLTASLDQLQKQIAAVRQQLAQLEQAAAKFASPHVETDPEVDWLNGGEAIAMFLKWPVKRVYSVYRTGGFKNAVWKTGWRSLIGSKSRLRTLPELLASENR